MIADKDKTMPVKTKRPKVYTNKVYAKNMAKIARLLIANEKERQRLINNAT